MDHFGEGIDREFKFILVGDSLVGKSNILQSFIKNRFSHELPSTIGIDYGNKKVMFEGKLINLKIWDTAGQERFRSLARKYYEDAHGVLVIFDVSKKNTFDNLDGWIQEVREFTNNQRIQIILIGNKFDLPQPHEIDEKQLREFAISQDLDYLLVSAMTKYNIETAFTLLLVNQIIYHEQKVIVIPEISRSATSGIKVSSSLLKPFLETRQEDERKCC